MPEIVKRPDPDRLLGDILENERSAGKGRLKVFLGMAAGVGKTYAMLEESYRLFREGRRIVIGYVETHGRRETEVLIRDLPVIQRRQIDHSGLAVEEFDLDKILEIKPEYAVVDELAHTNAEGSLHVKRYQDVIDLLDAGIHVLTTLNIQHLESQAAVVEKITGVRINETLPDSILDRADEIELVDIPPELLDERLKEGKVYIPEQARLAAENFFKMSNITALRELTLKYMAHRVDRDLDEYTGRKDIRGTWKSGEKILVAVSPSPYSEYLIRWTRRLAYNAKSRWIGLYVGDDRKLSDGAREKLHANLSLARELGAEVISTYDEDVVKGIIRVARQKNVTQIIVGKPLRRNLSDFLKGGSLVERILKVSGDIEIHVVTQPDPSGRKKSLRIPLLRAVSPFRDYMKAVLSVALVTAVGFAIVPLVGYWTIALLYLLCVVILALTAGRGPVLLTAIMSGLLWNYLFIPPLFTFRIGKIEDVMMFAMFVVIALVLGGMTSKLHVKENALRKREVIISNLYELSNLFEDARGIDDIVKVARNYIRLYLGMESEFIIPRDGGKLKSSGVLIENHELSEKDKGIIDWVFRNGKPAGLFTDTLPKADALFLPMRSQSHIVGVAVLLPEDRSSFPIEREDFIQNVISQISVRVERELLSSASRQLLLTAESERLHKTLLNTISHELRTPITAITGASTSLLDEKIKNNPAIRDELMIGIKKAGERLNHLVDNLLDMSRLESGHLSLKREHHDVNDLISVSMRRLRDDVGTHAIHYSVADDLPLVRIDFSLMERVIVNLLYNAILYTPEDSVVEVEAVRQDGNVRIAVKDNGPGLADEDIPYLFEKFRRGVHAASGGTGLGLSICRGIVEAHGGSIHAMNRSEGGAVFVVELPIDNAGDSEIRSNPEAV